MGGGGQRQALEMFLRGVALPNRAEAVREFLSFSRTCQLQLFSLRLGDQKGPNMPVVCPQEASDLLGFTGLKKALWRMGLTLQGNFLEFQGIFLTFHKCHSSSQILHYIQLHLLSQTRFRWLICPGKLGVRTDSGL